MSAAFLILFLFSAPLAFSERLINIKLERIHPWCPGLNTIGHLDKSTLITINHNVLQIIGTGNITHDITGELDIYLKVAKCRADNKCDEPGVTVIPNCCKYLTKLPFMSFGMGDSFTPAMRCPIRKGIYMANITFNLEMFAAMPIESKFWWKIRLMPYQVVKGKEKKVVVCVEGDVKIQEFGRRRGKH